MTAAKKRKARIQIEEALSLNKRLRDIEDTQKYFDVVQGMHLDVLFKRIKQLERDIEEIRGYGSVMPKKKARKR